MRGIFIGTSVSVGALRDKIMTHGTNDYKESRMLLGLARSLTSVLFVYLLEVWQNRAPHFLEHSILLGGLTPASLVKGLRRRCGCCVCHNFVKFRLKSEQVKQRASQKMDRTNIVDMHLQGL